MCQPSTRPSISSCAIDFRAVTHSSSSFDQETSSGYHLRMHRFGDAATCEQNSTWSALAADQVIIQIHERAHVQGQIIQRFAERLSLPGDSYLVPRGVPAVWHWRGGCEAIVITLEPPLRHGMVGECRSCASASVELAAQIGLRDPLLHQLGLALAGALQSRESVNRRYTDSLIHALTLHLFHNYTQCTKHSPMRSHQTPPSPMHRVTEYIQAHLNEELAVAELAALVHLSPYHFMRRFKATTGETVRQYIIRQRLETGQRLLLHSELTIAQIAVQVGFADQSHFCHYFKRMIGRAPSVLLKERRNLQMARTNPQDREPERRYTHFTVQNGGLTD